MRYFSNIKSSVVLNITKILLQLMNSVLLGRSVGSQGQGVIAFFFLVFDLIGTYGNFGITHATTFFYKSKGIEKKKLLSVNGTYLILNGLMFTGIILLLKDYTTVLDNYTLPFVFLGCSYFISMYFYNLFHEILVGDENIEGMNKLIFICTIIKAAMTCFMFTLNSLTVEWWLVIQVLINVLLMIALGIKSRGAFEFKFDFNLLFDEFKFGIIVYLSAFFGFLNYRIDQFMIKGMMTETDLGVYSIAVTISELAFFIPTCISAAFSGRLYNVDIEEKKKTLCFTVKFSFAACIIVVLIGILGSSLIPFVYGYDFRGSIVPTIILLIGVLFASIGKLISPYYISIGKPITHMLVAFVICVANVGLNAVLIPMWGLIGAAVASLISYIIYGGIYIVLLRLNEGITVKKLFLIKKGDIDILKKYSC